MRDLYFNSTNPKHSYKSEKFFKEYFKLRKTANFGSRSFLSNHKKLLVVKKFFMWYYFIPNVRFYKKIFSKTFAKQRITFRLLGAFFHLLERNVLVLLVRSQFAVNYMQALAMLQAGVVFVNGLNISRPFFSTQIGDIIENLTLLTYLLPYLFFTKALKMKKFRTQYFRKPLVGAFVGSLISYKRKNAFRFVSTMSKRRLLTSRRRTESTYWAL